MPDFEELTRDLRLHLAPDDLERARLRLKYSIQDLFRWRIAFVVGVIAILIITADLAYTIYVVDR